MNWAIAGIIVIAWASVMSAIVVVTRWLIKDTCCDDPEGKDEENVRDD